MCGCLICSPSPAEDTARGARAAAGTSTPQTGSAGPRATSTTWPVSPASPARGSCPPGRSSLWWRRRCSAGFTTTACWTTSSGPWREVSRPVRVRWRDPVLKILNIALIWSLFPRSWNSNLNCFRDFGAAFSLKIQYFPYCIKKKKKNSHKISDSFHFKVLK